LLCLVGIFWFYSILLLYIVLTYNDILGIKRFAGRLPVFSNTLDYSDGHRAAYLSNHKTRIAKMLAPNVIGHQDKKLALILSLIGAPENNGVRGRIHQLLIGSPGLAKTKLSRELVRVRQNSRYVSAKNSTGKSLTAMILKEDDNFVLNLGPVPLAKNAICVINEFDKMNPEEQDNLLDVMEEGEITVNKFAKLHTIKSSTTIIATANPKNNKWKDIETISIEEIPFEATKLSRFDMVLVFRDNLDETADRKFAYQKIQYDERHIQHNYNFLEKFVEYARSINPILTEEARSMLNEYWVKLRNREGLATTNRTLESIHRVAKAFCRLYLSEIVDARIAFETIDFMNKMFEEFYAHLLYVPDPRWVAYDETIKIIQQQKSPIDLIEAVRIVCQKNEQVKQYIGDRLEQNSNKKLRMLCNRVIDNKRIRRMRVKSVVVQWEEHVAGDQEDSCSSRTSDPSDLCDRKNDDLMQQQEEEQQPHEHEHETRLTSSFSDTANQNRSGHMGTLVTSVTPASTEDSSDIKQEESPVNRKTDSVVAAHSYERVNALRGLPNLRCSFCDEYYSPIKFDMELHLYEEHKEDLLKNLPVKKKGFRMDDRIAYVIDLMESEAIKNRRYFGIGKQ
jgi:MCM P-loop domain/MCM AAA-lid domain